MAGRCSPKTLTFPFYLFHCTYISIIHFLLQCIIQEDQGVTLMYYSEIKNKLKKEVCKLYNVLHWPTTDLISPPSVEILKLMIST